MAAEDLRYGVDSYGVHELLHMAAFLANAIEEEICQHPALQSNANWQQLARTAQSSIADLYQSIGSKHLPG